MDEHSLQVLGFYQITQRLKELSKTTLGKELSLRLKPLKCKRSILKASTETSEAKEFLVTHPTFSFSGIEDILPLVEKASKGGVLTSEEIRRIIETLRMAEFAKRTRRKYKPSLPTLDKFFERIETFRSLEQQFRRCIGQKGEVLDTATPELNGIRMELKRIRMAIHERLKMTMIDPELTKMLQARQIVIRNERYCIPVKVEFRTRFPGISHHFSQRKRTCFMEPREVIDLNNEYVHLKDREDREIQRILRDLSGEIAKNRARIDQTIEACGHLDFIFAKAALSIEQGATRPSINKTGYLRLIAARHPLLKGKVVPIDIWVGHRFNLLLITGPNTGGKTVSLKTTGLLTLMALSGLHIPAEEGSEVSVFTKVFADIGDEQSLEQNLSTFSSHIEVIKHIVKEADSASLVLLDEMASGTDPTEGACLARAILEYLIERSVRVIATTHSNELKTFVYLKEGAENANVEFDINTLSPTYKLRIGQPGFSNAFVIARELGLEPAIVDLAASLVGEDKSVVKDLIMQLESDRQRAEQARKDIEALRAEYEEKMRRIKIERDRVLEEAYIEGIKIIQDVRARAAQITSSKAPNSQKVLQGLWRYEGELQDRIDTLRSEIKPLSKDELRVGDVWCVKGSSLSGRVVSTSHPDRVELDVGGKRIWVSIGDLRKGERQEQTRLEERIRTPDITPDTSLRIIGLKVDEALSKVERYLSDAFSAGLKEVKIIHGIGSGALRTSIQRYLMEHRDVSFFRGGRPEEGGGGVTIVHFKD